MSAGWGRGSARSARSADIEPDALRQRQRARVVDGVGGPAHVGASRRRSPTRGRRRSPSRRRRRRRSRRPLGPMLTLAMPQSEPAADRKRSASRRSLVKMRRGQALRHVVVQRDRLVEVAVASARRGSARRSRGGRRRSAPASRRWPGGRRRRPGGGRPARARRRWTVPPSLLACGERRLHGLERGAVDQRADQRARLQRVADRHRARRRASAAPAARRATLVVDDQPAQAWCSAGRRCRRRRTAMRAQREVEVGRRARRSRRCCRRARAARGRSARPPCGADGAAHARSSRWPRPAARAGRRPAPRRASRPPITTL